MRTPETQRRSFLTRLNAGAGAVAATLLGGAAWAQSKSAPPARFDPERHDKDSWLDQLPGRHRVVFDTIAPDALGRAIRFADNFIRVNRTDYGLRNSDLAVVIIVRYRSVSFGYKDAIWAKYGHAISAQSGYLDPKSQTAPQVNVYESGAYGNLAPNVGTTLAALAEEGVQFAVCSLATHAVAGAIAGAGGGDEQAVYAELTNNLIANARIVPAGIVAVNRAQERGYTLVAG